MQKRRFFFLFLSFALHALALFSFVFLISDPLPTPIRETIEFDLPPPQAALGRGKKIKNSPLKKLNAADLRPEWNWKQSASRPEQGHTGSTSDSDALSSSVGEFDPHSLEGAYGHMEATGLEQSTSEMPFFQAIWKQIDQFMDFPEEIVRMRLSGQVVIHLKLNRQGLVVGDFQRINSDVPILKTYALLVLLQGLKKPLPKVLHLPEDHKDIPVVMTFHFRTVSMHGLDDDHGDYFKNSLLFRRTVYVDPVLNERVDYLLTKYMPPVIPFPGGVYVDFIRAYQMIYNYTHDVPDFYDQRQRRFDLLRDQLEQTLRKQGEVNK